MNQRTLLYQLASECEEIMKALNFTLPSNVTYKLNSRYTRTVGRCTKRGQSYIIEVAEVYFTAYAKMGSYKKIKQIILHELCHTLPNCMNHGDVWMHNARLVNSAYSYEISRYTSLSDVINVVHETSSRLTYIIQCKECGSQTIYHRRTKAVNYPSRYHCNKCGGRVELK